jgi:signal transduction histidine kinase
LQGALALMLGLLPPYLDIWAILFIIFGMQAIRYLRRTIAMLWLAVSILVVITALVLMFGATIGLTTSLSMIAGGVFLASYDLIYAQAETARERSQALLQELQDAHRKLQQYAAQAEELAATRERNHLARELHDAVNQQIFSITLNAQAARVLLDKDPARVSEQLDRLQEMTSGALAQLRSLITQWRPQPKD